MGRPRKVQSEQVEADTHATSNLEESQEVTFAEAEGTPANKHAKKLAKEKAKKKANEAIFKHFYTVNRDKVLKIVCKPGAAYSVYIGNMKKSGDSLNVQIAKWKKEGLWCSWDNKEELTSKYCSGKE
jgi:hypothetical protein